MHEVCILMPCFGYSPTKWNVSLVYMIDSLIDIYYGKCNTWSMLMVGTPHQQHPYSHSPGRCDETHTDASGASHATFL